MVCITVCNHKFGYACHLKLKGVCKGHFIFGHMKNLVHYNLSEMPLCFTFCHYALVIRIPHLGKMSSIRLFIVHQQMPNTLRTIFESIDCLLILLKSHFRYFYVYFLLKHILSSDFHKYWNHMWIDFRYYYLDVQIPVEACKTNPKINSTFQGNEAVFVKVMLYS